MLYPFELRALASDSTIFAYRFAIARRAWSLEWLAFAQTMPEDGGVKGLQELRGGKTSRLL